MKVIIALGSSCLQPAHIQWASQRLGSLLSDMHVSRTLWTKDIKGTGVMYMNRLVSGYTSMNVNELESELKAIEQDAGRTHERITIDLDLMQYGDQRYHERDWPRPYIQRLLPFLVMLLCCLCMQAQSFHQHFADSTLRLDYIFAGDARHQAIYLDELHQSPRWYGRRHHLSELPVEGSGSITVTDPQSGDTIYRHSFSTLFQEWLSTAEAKRVQRSFQNVFLIPFPKHPVCVSVELRDFHHRVMTQMQHVVDPSDILIRKMSRQTPYTTLQQSSDSLRCIHIAFVAEGYTAQQMEQYLDDCRTAMESLFQHEPFRSLRSRFQIVALLSASKDTDVSQPGKGLWLNTALGSHFDTFYSERYLTTLQLKRLHDVLAGTPYEHIIILANTAHYGGGGIYNSYNLCYTRGKHFRPVVVHEFGHSFGGLGDEYPYGDDDPMYFPDVEPWEPNLTTHTAYPAKWQDLIDAGKASLIEGGGYLSKGVWRAQEDCRMRTNEHPDFCPVCQQALRRLILFYTE